MWRSGSPGYKTALISEVRRSGIKAIGRFHFGGWGESIKHHAVGQREGGKKTCQTIGIAFVKANSHRNMGILEILEDHH